LPLRAWPRGPQPPQSRDQSPHERFKDARDLFDLNKFQHKQVEHQQALRKALDLRTDVPLRLGLAEPGTGAREDLLLFAYHLLNVSGMAEHATLPRIVIGLNL